MGGGFYAPLRKILLDHGCELRRQGKGHEIWHGPINGRSFPVAVTITSRVLVSAIFKQTGIVHKL